MTALPDAGPYALVGDIGGTNCRLALARPGAGSPEFLASRTLLCADYPTFEAALSTYLADAGRPVVVNAAVAVAGPVVAGAVAMTNHPWSITEDQLSAALGGGAARLINDYAALAYAAPSLSGTDLLPIGPRLHGPAEGTIAVMGAGTGFGVSALVRDGGTEAVLVGEGGHAAFAPGDEVEVEIRRFLAGRHGRVSIERILSGPGLLGLHQALSHIDGTAPCFHSPESVAAAAVEGDARGLAATMRFCAVLGAVAGDFALAYGAKGGVQIAGGVSQKLLATPAGAAFRPRFEDKGRFRSYLAEIPTNVVAHPHAALVGALRALPDPA